MKRGFWLWTATLVTYAFLYTPLAVVVLFGMSCVGTARKESR